MPRPEDPEVWIAPAVPVPDLADCLDSFYDNPGSLPQAVPAPPGSHPDDVLLELEEAPVDIGGHSLTELLRPAYPAMSHAARQRITGPGRLTGRSGPLGPRRRGGGPAD